MNNTPSDSPNSSTMGGGQRERFPYPPLPPKDDKKGCRIALGIVGWLLSLAGLAIIGLSLIVIFAGEAAQRDRERASKEYYEKYGDRINAPVGDDSLAVVGNDSVSVFGADSLALADADSLALEDIPEPPPIGFNIGGAFGLFFAFIGMIPLIIGIVLIFIAYRMKKRRYH